MSIAPPTESGVGVIGEFNPTDEEIILEYLTKKIDNEAFHTDMIDTVDFFAFTPDYFSETYRASGDGVWYYFTRRRRKHRHGHVVDRTAGGGYWNAYGPNKHIMHNGREIGMRRGFVEIL
ncbi:NAC domain-containing protein 72-like [Salvia divinorum]|uniref:NAC domain-containing protein 72-like n=1 Tax=Salvia divinorum TaxID=28513 RepID=A0ABD1IFT8_SALDI